MSTERTCSGRIAATLLAASLLTPAGCISSTARAPQFSVPVASSGPLRDIDAGHISVHATVARAVPFGTERLTLGQLVNAEKIFQLLLDSRQSARLQQTYTGGSVGLAFSAPLLQSRSTTETSGATGGGTTKQISSSTDTSDGAKESGTSSTSDESTTNASTSANLTTQTTSQVPQFDRVPSGNVTFQSPSGAVGATPYELFYSTSESLLAARSLENLYNVADGPEGWTLFSMPVIATFEPGRITRNNYTAESVITMAAPAAGSVTEIKLVAVAPAGLSSFASSTLSEMNRLQASLGVGVPLGAAAAQLQAGAMREALDAFTSMARRPDLQVSIAGDSTLVVRYLGRETFQGGVALGPASFNMEVLVLLKVQPQDKHDTRAELVTRAAPRAPEVATALDLTVATTSRFKPVFPSRERRASAEAVVVRSIPNYTAEGNDSNSPAVEKVRVYVPAVATRVNSALYFPDGRIVLGGTFPRGSCTCFDLFVGDETKATPLMAPCRWADDTRASLAFEVSPPHYPDAKQKERLAGRIALYSRNVSKDLCPSGTGQLPPPEELQSIASIAVTLTDPKPTPSPASQPAGTAVLRAVAGALDNLGATLFIEYDGTASDPLVLVDGLPAARTRLELVRKKTGDGPEMISGGRVWVRIPGVHDAKLTEKTFLLSVGAGEKTGETRVVTAKR